MDTGERNSVIVIGDFDFDPKPFTERSLALCKVTIEKAPEFYNLAKAVIVADFPGKFGLIKDCFTKIFPQAEDHGLALVVIAHSPEDFDQIAAIKQLDKNGSVPTIIEINELWRAAEHVSKYRIGPSAGKVQIEPTTLELDDDDSLLLRRAFHDCERIYLEPIGGGKASMSVFRIHAWMKQSEVGPLPLPFFAKIATPRDVDAEKENYRTYAEHYIPFNLRPNIDRHRCVSTRSKAALVGNFVDDAVPIREALRSGHGIGSLFSLFETTLRGFRLQPFASSWGMTKEGLDGFVSGRIKLEDLLQKPKVIERAHEFGLATTPEALHAKISSAAKALSHYTGPYHGDLHSGNVMVRGGDAILIDFGSTGHGPLTADPATLEASLMFATESWETEAVFTEWRVFIDEIYGSEITTLHPPALFETKPGRFSWLRRSLRELRHVLLACEGSGEEAKVVLASYLMRYARLDIETLKNAQAKTLAFDRHCYALVVAERIANGFSASHATEGEKT
jgi:hypothetical protein